LSRIDTKTKVKTFLVHILFLFNVCTFNILDTPKTLHLEYSGTIDLRYVYHHTILKFESWGLLQEGFERGPSM